MPATPAWLAAIEALLNRGIGSSLEAGILARRLDGSALHIEVVGLTAVRASIMGSRLALSAPGDPASERSDATITGSPSALLHLARGGTDRRAKFEPAQVRGDGEIADSYRRLFALAAPDPEEELSRIVGDLPARRLSQLAKHVVAWARGARRTAGENVAEYLQEESRDLVNKPEFEEFLQGVDELREIADRVEARLSRLEQRLKGSG